MRNTLKYPVTAEEAVEILATIQSEKSSEMLFGDIRPYALRLLIDFLELDLVSSHFDEFCKNR